MTLQIKDRFPDLFRGGTITIDEVGVFIKAKDQLLDGKVQELRKSAFDGKQLAGLTGWLRRTDVLQVSVPLPGGWNPDTGKVLSLGGVAPDTVADIDDIWLLCHYTYTAK